MVYLQNQSCCFKNWTNGTCCAVFTAHSSSHQSREMGEYGDIHPCSSPGVLQLFFPDPPYQVAFWVTWCTSGGPSVDDVKELRVHLDLQMVVRVWEDMENPWKFQEYLRFYFFKKSELGDRVPRYYQWFALFLCRWWGFKDQDFTSNGEDIDSKISMMIEYVQMNTIVSYDSYYDIIEYETRIPDKEYEWYMVEIDWICPVASAETRLSIAHVTPHLFDNEVNWCFPTIMII